jgi:hypothetical protein
MAVLVRKAVPDHLAQRVAALRANRTSPTSAPSKGPDMWYMGPEGTKMPGVAPEGAFHSGHFHQLFTQHVPEDRKDAFTALTSRGPSIKDAVVRGVNFVGNYRLAQGDVEGTGKWLAQVHEAMGQHGISKDEGYQHAYRGMRRRHAREVLAQGGQYKPTFPVKEDTGVAIEPPEFRTSHDASRWLETHAPHVNYAVSNLHPGAIQSTTNQLTQLFTKYPHVAHHLHVVGNKDEENLHPDHRFESNHLAAASNDNRAIYLNPDWYRDHDKLREALAINHHAGHFSEGSVESNISHEFGHQVKNEMLNHPQFSGLFEDWERANWHHKPVSGYGKTNNSERFAEGFAVMQHEHAKDWPSYVRNMHGLLQFREENPDYKPGDEIPDHWQKAMGLSSKLVPVKDARGHTRMRHEND